MRKLLIGLLLLTSVASNANVDPNSRPSSIELIDLISSRGQIDPSCDVELYAGSYDISVRVGDQYLSFGTHAYYDSMHSCRTGKNGEFICGRKSFTIWGSGAATRHHFICSTQSLRFEVNSGKPVLKIERILYQAIMKNLMDDKDCNAPDSKVTRVEIPRVYASLKEHKTIRRECKVY
jgi:hypothetical protein